MKNTRKTAKEIYESGSFEDFDKLHIVEIINGLYKRSGDVAHAWFIGCGWPEGFEYCKNQEYLKNTFARNIIESYKMHRAVWFACRFL